MLNQDLVEIIDLVNEPLYQSERKRNIAASLTDESVKYEAAKWANHVDDHACYEYVELISLNENGPTLLKTLRAALSSDELKDIVDAAWERFRPEPATTNSHGEQYIFDNEEEGLAAVGPKCPFVWNGGRLRCALKDAEGHWFLVSMRDAEIAMAPYRYIVDTEKVVRDSNHRPIIVDGNLLKIRKRKDVSIFSLLAKSPQRHDYQGAGYYPSPNSTPKGYLNLWRGTNIEPATDLKWLGSVLSAGSFPSKRYGSDVVKWPDEGGAVLKDAMFQSYQDAVPSKPPATREQFAHFLKKSFRLSTIRRRTAKSGRKREPHYILCPLQDARRIFIETNPVFKRNE